MPNADVIADRRRSDFRARAGRLTRRETCVRLEVGKNHSCICIYICDGVYFVFIDYIYTKHSPTPVQVVYSVVKTVQLFTVLQLSLHNVELRTEAMWLGLGCLVPLTFGDS